MGEAELEGAPGVQAMGQKGSEVQGAPARGLPEGTQPGVPESEDVVRWVAAGIVAASALLGLVVLVAMLAYVLEPPAWVQTVLGLALAAGAVFFAWLLASALRKDDADSARSAPRRR